MVSISRFDPSGFDADVYAVQFRSLGRKKGFEKVAEYSILNSGNPTIELIKDRILSITKFFLDTDCIRSKEILSSLKIETISPKTFHKLEVELAELKQLYNEEASELRNVYDEAHMLTEQIEETLETDKYVYEFEWAPDDYPIEALKERVDILINEYETLEAEAEEKKESEDEEDE